MATKRQSVGLLTAFTPEIFKSEYHTRILSGVMDALRLTRYDLRFIPVKPEEYMDQHRKILSEYGIEGLLLLTWTIHPRYLEEAQDLKIPVVMINDYTEGNTHNIVYCKNEPGIRNALRHLANKGYKKIGMLQGPDEDSLDARERYLLFKNLIAEYGITFDIKHYRKCEYFFEEDGYLKMLDMIQNCKDLPRAVICFNDDLAVGALRALKESWIACPEQVAVIGYDGIQKGQYVVPPLTTIGQPLEKMGSEMVAILTGLMEGELKPPVQRCFSPEIIIRQSC